MPGTDAAFPDTARSVHGVSWAISTYREESRSRDDTALKMRIKETTDAREHDGYRSVHVTLRREAPSLRLKRPRRKGED